MKDKWIRSDDSYKMDLSLYYKQLMDSAIELVMDEDFWDYDDKIMQFKLINDMECVSNAKKFKVISNVGLELLVKAVCVKREIDIFKSVNEDIKYNSIFSILKIDCANNTWLKSIFVKYDYEFLSDINTCTFRDCLTKLEVDLLNKPSIALTDAKSFIDSIDKIRKYHRNIECHIFINLNVPEIYEKDMLNAYNQLLTLYHET